MNHMSANHMTAQEMNRWWARELTVDDLLVVSEHLAGCQRCSAELASAYPEEVVAADLARQLAVPEPVVARRAWRAVPWAMAAAALLALLLVYRISERRPGPEISNVAALPASSERAVLAEPTSDPRAPVSIALPSPGSTVPAATVALEPGPESQRSIVDAPTVAVGPTVPRSVAALEARPTFCWQGPGGVARKAGSFAPDLKILGGSEALESLAWQPPDALVSGQLLTWTVQATLGGGDIVKSCLWR